MSYQGTIIKKLRIEKKMTQESLCKGLCSIKQLSRIEQNHSNPSIYLFSKFAERLSTELYDFIPYSSELNGFEIKREIDILYKLFENQQHSAIYSRIKQSKLLTTNNTHVRKEIGWITGAISNYININKIITPEYYFNLLSINYSITEFHELFEMQLKPIDYKILNSIIVLFLKAEDFDYAELLLKKAIANFEEHRKNIFDSCYSRYLYNYSRMKLITNNFLEALILSKKGIEYNLRFNSLSYLADLYNIYGRALHKLKKVPESAIALKTSITLFSIIKTELDTDKLIKHIRNKYKL